MRAEPTDRSIEIRHVFVERFGYEPEEAALDDMIGDAWACLALQHR